MADNETHYLFLTGADMDPTEVRRNYPTARFVARGFAEAHAGAISSTFAEVVASPGVGDIWGILIEVDGTSPADTRHYDVTTDDGRTINATAVGDRLVSGLATEVYTAARYWELPPGYAGRLKMVTPKLGVSGSADDD